MNLLNRLTRNVAKIPLRMLAFASTGVHGRFGSGNSISGRGFNSVEVKGKRSKRGTGLHLALFRKRTRRAIPVPCIAFGRKGHPYFSVSERGMNRGDLQ